MVKYVPDVSRALFGILNGMRKRKAEWITSQDFSPTKRMRLNLTRADVLISKLENTELSEAVIKKNLVDAIEAQMRVDEYDDVMVSPEKTRNRNGLRPLYLLQLPDMDTSTNDIEHPLFTFRPLKVK